jgi:hypothetical protein
MVTRRTRRGVAEVDATGTAPLIFTNSIVASRADPLRRRMARNGAARDGRSRRGIILMGWAS